MEPVREYPPPYTPYPGKRSFYLPALQIFTEVIPNFVTMKVLRLPQDLWIL